MVGCSIVRVTGEPVIEQIIITEYENREAESCTAYENLFQTDRTFQMDKQVEQQKTRGINNQKLTS